MSTAKTNNLRYLGNGARFDVSQYYSLIESRTSIGAFDTDITSVTLNCPERRIGRVLVCVISRHFADFGAHSIWKNVAHVRIVFGNVCTEKDALKWSLH